MTLKQLTQLMNIGMSVDEAADQLRVMLQDDALVAKVLAERQSIIDAYWKLSIGSAVVDPEDMPAPWYTGPVDTDKYWPKLRESLMSDSAWVKAVPSLDDTSTRIVGLLADPHSPVIDTRGLVLGYVQSGKTANFTATIAKAADAGYRMFIVLSGVHNSLRRQTQLRVDEQLCELNPTEWIQLTDEERDFGNPVKALPLVAGTQLRLLAVVKKNVSRLSRLQEWLETAHQRGGLDNCPVLIIDDEADQASPNSHRDPDLDRTRINEELVKLLSLPRVAYVGYTATPFANVLANPADLMGIYPRTFIQSLPKPEGYFGAEELFGSPVSEEEEPGTQAPHDMIRFVPPSEADLYIVKTGEPHVPVVTSALKDAVRWFVLATTARRLRSGTVQHSSMLVHTTMRVAPQLNLVIAIKALMLVMRDEWRNGDRSVWTEQWDREAALEPSILHGLRHIDFQHLEGAIDGVLQGVNVVADNGVSSERLLYADDPVTVIAVGGNTLSRGLTLHGLISSFFLRSSNAYDSVLQMGRWFGYRPGYADLPRIWTTKSLAEDFRFLSGIEAELRQDIERYAAGNITPAQLAVRIQLHPRMQPTSRIKMQYAVKASASFSEHRPQSTYLRHRDADVAKRNLAATRTLLENAPLETRLDDASTSYLVYKGLAHEAIVDFLGSYKFHPSSEMANDLLKKYVQGQVEHGALMEWNVAIATRKVSHQHVDLGLDDEVNLLTRSKLKLGSDDSTANLGTLMSRKDRLVDLEGSALHVEDTDAVLQGARNANGRALLLIYPIDKDSAPKPGATYRLKLGAIDHQIGVAFVFPQAAPGSEATDKIQVDLRTITADEADDDMPYSDVEGSRNEVALDE